MNETPLSCLCSALPSAEARTGICTSQLPPSAWFDQRVFYFYLVFKYEYDFIVYHHKVTFEFTKNFPLVGN